MNQNICECVDDLSKWLKKQFCNIIFFCLVIVWYECIYTIEILLLSAVEPYLKETFLVLIYDIYLLNSISYCWVIIQFIKNVSLDY